MEKVSKLNLINKINSKSATIGIYGLGYIGLPLALRFVELDFKVIGFDINKEKISRLKKGQSYISHIKSSQINKAINKNFLVTDNYSLTKKVDVLIICVPTPLTKFREPDLSYVIKTMNSIVNYIKKGQVLSLESTTYPGTTEEVLFPIISSKNLKIGKDFFLLYSPEREDPGNKNFSTQKIPKLVSGYTKNCLKIGLTLYSKIIEKVIPLSSTRAAEMTKLLENIYRSVNIGLVNEMKILSDHMNLDIYEIIRAASSKPFGFTPFYPGPGIGGHCIPIDPFYLSWKAKEYNLRTHFIELAGEVNSKMPNWVVNKTLSALNSINKSVNDSKILICGIAYKKNIDDIRESPALMVIKLLQQMGAKVDFIDPYVNIFPKKKEFKNDIKKSTSTPKKIASYDALIITTDHSDFDYDMFQKRAKLIIDTRGVYKDTYRNVVRA